MGKVFSKNVKISPKGPRKIKISIKKNNNLKYRNNSWISTLAKYHMCFSFNPTCKLLHKNQKNAARWMYVMFKRGMHDWFQPHGRFMALRSPKVRHTDLPHTGYCHVRGCETLCLFFLFTFMLIIFGQFSLYPFNNCLLNHSSNLIFWSQNNGTKPRITTALHFLFVQ